MTRKKMLSIPLVLAMVGVFCIGEAFSQQGRDRGTGDRAARAAEGRARMAERLKEQLGATEEEWKALSPLIEKVTTLSFQARMGGRSFGRGRRDGQRSGAEGTGDQPETEIAKATQALRELTEKEGATAEEFKAALKALRQARAKIQKELAEARDALREVVTVKQEAQLVLMGTLE